MLLTGVQASLVINEIHYHPYARDGKGEFVEILNHSSSPINLSGYRLTGGIDYSFPPSLIIPAGAFLIVTDAPEQFSNSGSALPPQGPYEGRLSNSSDRIRLRNARGDVIDEVTYADAGFWPLSSDGGGPSLELIHPDFPNQWASSWSPSKQPGGSPGAENSSYMDDPPPAVGQVIHSPLFPEPGQDVIIRAQIRGIGPNNPQPLLLYRNPEQTTGWSEVALFDDGKHQDILPSDFIFAAVLSGLTEPGLIEFKIKTSSAAGNISTYPAPTPDFSCLVPIGAAPPSTELPAYQLLLSPENREWLETRDVFSDIPVHATFIGPDGSVFYDATTRYRGSTSRTWTRKSFRVDFSGDHTFQGVEKLNLQGRVPTWQWVSYDLSRRAGLPTPETQLVWFYINHDEALLYLQVEAVDTPMLEREFGADAGDGNLYKAVKGGDLAYYGEDPFAYKSRYSKENNTEEDDWTDLIQLSHTMSISDTDRFNQEVEQFVDIDNLCKFMAVRIMLNDLEGGIWRSTGDDYFLYVPPGPGQAELIPWDFDSTFREASETIWVTEVPSVRRILRSNEFGTRYISALNHLLHDEFSDSALRERLTTLPAEMHSKEQMEYILGLAAERRSNVACEISRELTWTEEAHPRWNPCLDPETPWRFFRGTREPSDGTRDWTLPDFDDTAWEVGFPPFHSSENNANGTSLPDMLGNYVSLYLRIPLEAEDIGAFCGSGGLVWRAFFSDAIVVYLNGKEFGRMNIGSEGKSTPFSQRAYANHESDVREDFYLRPMPELIQDGTNVIAIQCHNQWFSAPGFTIDGGLWAIGFDKPSMPFPTLFAHQDANLSFSGRIDQTRTQQVLLNGMHVTHSLHEGVWEGVLPLQPGWNEFSLQAYGQGGMLLDQGQTGRVFFQAEPAAILSGILSGDTILRPEDGAVLIRGELEIPGNTRLEVRAGTSLFFENNSVIRALGELQFQGSQNKPIMIGPASTVDEDAYLSIIQAPPVEGIQLDHVKAWNVRMEFNGSSEGAFQLRHSTFHQLADQPVISLRNQARLTIEHCRFQHHGEGTVVAARDQSSVLMVHSLIYGGDTALALRDEARAELEHITFADCSQSGITLEQISPKAVLPLVTIDSSIIWDCNQSIARPFPQLFRVAFSNLEFPDSAVMPGESNQNSDPLLDPDSNPPYQLDLQSPSIGAGRNDSDQGYLASTGPSRWEAF